MFSEWCFFSSGFSFVLYNSTVRLCRYHNRASVYRRSVAFNLYEATILYRCDRWVYYRLEKSFAQSAGLAGIRTRTIRFKTSSSGVFECALSVPLFFFFLRSSLSIMCGSYPCWYSAFWRFALTFAVVVPFVGLPLRGTAGNGYLWTLRDTPKYSQLVQLIHVDTKETAVRTETKKRKTRDWVHNVVLVTVYKEKTVITIFIASRFYRVCH